MKIRRTFCWTAAACQEAESFLLSCTLIACDIETIPYRKKNKFKQFIMTVVSYTGLKADGSMESFAFPFQTSKSIVSKAPENIEWIYYTCQRINASGIPFTGHNFTYDLAWFLRYLMPVKNYAYDSMTMWWAKYPELPKTLDFVSSILLDHYQYWKFGRKEEDYIKYMHYAMNDTESTLMNTCILIEMCIDDSKMRQNFIRAHARCIAGLSMSMKGLAVVEEQMEKYRVSLTATAKTALERVRYLVADMNFNPNSSQQKSVLLYQLLGARKRNEKGRFVAKESDASTGAVALRAMRNDHPIFRRVANGIMESIEPAKQLSNVVGLQFLSGATAERPRFLTSYDGVGTTTSRFSSRGSAFGHGGNAQNVRKDYRPFAEADSDSFLLEVDFSAADDVFVSFESQEPKKIELVRSGKDIHATNALIFFGNWTYESIVQLKKAKDPRIVHPITGIRQITKKLVHGNHYLMAGLTLLMSAGREAIVAAAKELGYEDAGFWSQEKLVKFCELLETKFRDWYPRFKRHGNGSWYNDLRQEVMDTGGFTTCFGYYQRFLSDPRDDSTLRAVAATAGQANTAGRVNMALDELILGLRTMEFRDGPAPDRDSHDYTISELSHGISVRLQTHDSIAFNIRHNHPNWHDGFNRIMAAMNRPVLCKGEVFKVGIEADISYRWGGKESRTINTVEEAEKFLSEVNRNSL